MTTIIRLDSTESTNRDAFALAEQDAEHGTVVIAASQTKGRGRLGKSWSSPPGKGLYCSIIIRPQLDPFNYPRLTFVAGLAVAEVVERNYNLHPMLKWPNDIYFKRQKCGGILTESSDLNKSECERFAVVGIGLNINTTIDDFPLEIRDTATSLKIELGHDLQIEKVFKQIHKELLKQIAEFEQSGFNPVISRWRARDLLLGQRLAWVSVTGQRIQGVSLGPDDDGQLHVRDDNGKIHEVLSGDIQLATH